MDGLHNTCTFSECESPKLDNYNKSQETCRDLLKNINKT